MSYPIDMWAKAFVETCVIEGAVHAVTLRRLIQPWWKLALVSVLLNLSTHPALWYVVPRFEPYLTWVAVAETGVWLVEGALLTAVLRRDDPTWRAAARGFGITLLANAISTLYGLLGWG